MTTNSPRAIRGTMLVVSLAVFLAMVPGTARAKCGDVTGEGKTTASDALAVLRSAVGQPVELMCVVDILDSSLTANYGSVEAVSGFVPDPYTRNMTSGGPVHVEFLGNNCRGFATSAPDLRLNYTAGAFPTLRFYFVGSGDTTMIVNDPESYFSRCGDDSYGTSNPTVDFENPRSGFYDIWIGSYHEGESVSGTLYITESTGNHP